MRAALRISDRPITTDEFEPAPLASDSGSSSTAAVKAEVAEQPTKWINLALASVLTLAPINIPVEMYSRRYGVASTMNDWFDVEDEWEDLCPGGIFSPSPERKILFRKTLRLVGLEKRKPYINF